MIQIKKIKKNLLMNHLPNQSKYCSKASEPNVRKNPTSLRGLGTELYMYEKIKTAIPFALNLMIITKERYGNIHNFLYCIYTIFRIIVFLFLHLFIYFLYIYDERVFETELFSKNHFFMAFFAIARMMRLPST